MARRLQLDDKPVKPVAPSLPANDLSEALRQYNASLDAATNTFPPEAAASVRQLDAVARVIENGPDTEQNRALAGAARTLILSRNDAPRMHITPPPAEHITAARAAVERQQRESEAQSRLQREVNRLGHDEALARLFQQPAQPTPKPTVDVMTALGFLARKPAAFVELHHVAADMSVRGGRFTSQRQFEYAKAICNKPRNRQLLRAEYDLTALDREEWGGGPGPAARQTTYPPGVKVGFECVIVGATPQAVSITFGYNFEGRQTVRTIQVPSNRITIRGNVGDRVRCSVDAEWMLTERRITPTLIVTANLHSGGAGWGQPTANPVRRRARTAPPVSRRSL